DVVALGEALEHTVRIGASPTSDSGKHDFMHEPVPREQLLTRKGPRGRGHRFASPRVVSPSEEEAEGRGPMSPVDGCVVTVLHCGQVLRPRRGITSTGRI
ncbi:MAG: hypothetical protein AN485_22945, partial [Anabaena sp. MDT14b]